MTPPDPGAPPGAPGREPPIVGLRREREVLAVALDTGRHMVIEGLPGSGNPTLRRDIARTSMSGRDC
jgi:MoxR-like ATPase